MELRQLRSFIAVAEELHFGRAAQHLQLAQPALSRQIQNLERDLGFQLFSRTRRRVQLTSAGSVFLDRARSLFASLDEAIDAAQRAASGRTGSLAVGFVGSASYGVLPSIFQAFRLRSPQVELTLSEMITSAQLQALRERRIDIGFLRFPFNAQGITLKTIVREPMLVALPAGHRLAGQRTLPLRALAGEPFVLFPRQPNPTWVDFVVGMCNKVGFEPNIVQRAVEIQTAISLVSAGVGVTLVPASVENLPRKGVVYRRLKHPCPRTELMVAYRDDNSSPVLRSFLQVMWDIVRHGNAAGPHRRPEPSRLSVRAG